MNKNLMAIFHQDLRVGDEIFSKGYGQCKILDIVATRGIKEYKIQWVENWLKAKDLKLITPFVPLYEVLEKLNEIAEKNYTYILTPPFVLKKSKLNMVKIRVKDFTLDKDRHYKLDTIFLWLLSDKSGEVPLHRQSKETQDQIYEVLK